MKSSALPLILLGGGALLLMSGNKKKRSSASGNFEAGKEKVFTLKSPLLISEGLKEDSTRRGEVRRLQRLVCAFRTKSTFMDIGPLAAAFTGFDTGVYDEPLRQQVESIERIIYPDQAEESYGTGTQVTPDFLERLKSLMRDTYKVDPDAASLMPCGTIEYPTIA